MTARELIEMLAAVDPEMPIVVKSGKFGYALAAQIEPGFFIRGAGAFDPVHEDDPDAGLPNAVLISG